MEKSTILYTFSFFISFALVTLRTQPTTFTYILTPTFHTKNKIIIASYLLHTYIICTFMFFFSFLHLSIFISVCSSKTNQMINHLRLTQLTHSERLIYQTRRHIIAYKLILDKVRGCRVDTTPSISNTGTKLS